jgi:hypothetical protein
MTFTIHASKNDQCVTTIRINPVAAVDKARMLETLGWQVHVINSAGRQFDPQISVCFCCVPTRPPSAANNPILFRNPLRNGWKRVTLLNVRKLAWKSSPLRLHTMRLRCSQNRLAGSR